MACLTVLGFSLPFAQQAFAELIHHAGTADTVGTASALTIHYLLQVVSAQSEGRRDYSGSEHVQDPYMQ